jgi:hypothetical protein
MAPEVRAGDGEGRQRQRVQGLIGQFNCRQQPVWGGNGASSGEAEGQRGEGFLYPHGED